MTIGSWVFFGFIVLCAIGGVIWFCFEVEGAGVKAIGITLAVLICIGAFCGLWWYHHSTASGIRALTDQRAEFSNGLNREINVYTADGNLLAHYEGKIDLEDNAGGYVLFDYEGKRYTYYNCFVESIADIR